MSALQKYIGEIYKYINGRADFNIPWLQETVTGERNNGAFRELPRLQGIELVRKAAGSAPAKYRLERGFSREAFIEQLIEPDILPGHIIGVPRWEGKLTNHAVMVDLLNISNMLVNLSNMFKPVAEFKEPVKFKTEAVEGALSLIATWLERYKNDPRSTSDDARFALFILEEDN